MGAWVIGGAALTTLGLTLLAAQTSAGLASLVLCAVVYLAAIVRGLGPGREATQPERYARDHDAPAPAAILAGTTALTGLVATAPQVLIDQRGWDAAQVALLIALALTAAVLVGGAVLLVRRHRDRGACLRGAILLAGVLSAMAAAASAGTTELAAPLLGLAVVAGGAYLALVRVGAAQLAIGAALGAVIAGLGLGASLALATCSALSLVGWAAIRLAGRASRPAAERLAPAALGGGVVIARALAEAAATHEDAPERT